MIEYITYNGVKYPFLISFSTLIEFEKRTKSDFVTVLSHSDNMLKLAENLILILELGLETGYRVEKPNLFKIILNYLKSGNHLGIKKSKFPHIIDQQWQELLELIPKFFFDLQDDALKSAEDIVERSNKKK